MALSPRALDNRLSLANQALNRLGIDNSDLSSIGASSTEGLAILIDALNSNLEPPIEFDAKIGYTPELGDEITEKVEEFRALKQKWLGFVPVNVYNKLKEWWSSGKEDKVREKLDEVEGMPQVFIDDPEKLFWLIDRAEATVRVFNDLYAEGYMNPNGPPVVTEPDTPDVPDTSVPSEPDPKLETDDEKVEEAPTADPDEEILDLEVVIREETVEEQIEEATGIVELALGGADGQPGLTSALNDAIDKKRQGLEENTGMWGALINVFAQRSAGDLLSMELPENIEIGGEFDMNSQAALQGVMTVLSHPMVLNMQGGKFAGMRPWEYTEVKGQHILDNLDKISDMMGDDVPQEIKDQLTPENVEALINAMNTLNKHNQLVKYQIFGGTPLETSHGIQVMLQDAASKYETLDGASELFDQMIRGYAGFGLNSFLDEDVELALVEGESQQAIFADLYRRTQASFLAKNPDGDFNAFMMMMTYESMSVPMGTDNHRQIFQDGVTAAIASGDPEAFAAEMDATVARLNALGPSTYEHRVNRSVSWHPSMSEPGLQFGDYSVADIAAVFAARQTARGMEHLEYQDPMYFEVDGKYYVAAIEWDSKFFRVEEIDLDKIRADVAESMANGYDTETLLTNLRADNPGFALLMQENGLDFLDLGQLHPDYIDDALVSRFDPLDRMEVEITHAHAERDAEEVASASVYDGSRSTLPYETFILPSPIEADDLESARDAQAQRFRDMGDIKVSTANMRVLEQMAGYATDGPKIVTPEQLAALREAKGESLPIGVAGNTIRVRAVNIEGLQDGGREIPALAVYDAARDVIVAFDVPPYMRDPAAFQVLLDGPLKQGAGESDNDYAQRIQQDYPAVFLMAENYRFAHERRAYRVPNVGEYETLAQDIDRVVRIQVKPLVENYRYVPPVRAEAERSFGERAADMVMKPINEQVEGVRDIVDDTREQGREFGERLPQVPKRAEEEVRGIVEAGREVAEGIKDKAGEVFGAGEEAAENRGEILDNVVQAGKDFAGAIGKEYGGAVADSARGIGDRAEQFGHVAKGRNPDGTEREGAPIEYRGDNPEMNLSPDPLVEGDVRAEDLRVSADDVTAQTSREVTAKTEPGLVPRPGGESE